MTGVTEVKISFFKPTGYEDTYHVATTDRGAAAKKVMERCEFELPRLNYILTRIVDERYVPENSILEL
jgi:hypothetical protein